MDELRQVEVGKVYRHFKGTHVILLATAKHTETGEMLAVYQVLHDRRIWARPYEMFVSEVDHEKYPDVEQKYRFELVKGETKPT